MDKEVSQGSVQRQDVEVVMRHAHGTEFACAFHGQREAKMLKNLVRKNEELRLRRVATSQIWLCRLKVKFHMSKVPISMGCFGNFGRWL